MTEPARKPRRWKGHDYGSAGYYFFTICTHQRRPVLSEVTEQGVLLSDAGEMVNDAWLKLPQLHSGVSVDAWVIMPDHVHGILVLEQQSASVTLSRILGGWKSFTTRRYMDGVRNDGWPPFEGRLWQPSLNDRVIRDETELQEIRRYIVDNPSRWFAAREEHTGRSSETGLNGTTPRPIAMKP